MLNIYTENMRTTSVSNITHSVYILWEQNYINGILNMGKWWNKILNMHIHPLLLCSLLCFKKQVPAKVKMEHNCCKPNAVQTSCVTHLGIQASLGPSARTCRARKLLAGFWGQCRPAHSLNLRPGIGFGIGSAAGTCKAKGRSRSTYIVLGTLNRHHHHQHHWHRIRTYALRLSS